MSASIAALRQAAKAVRAQIPRAELTRQSVERLLAAAEAVCAEAGSSPVPETKKSARTRKRQEVRNKWAEIARQNAEKASRSPARVGPIRPRS
jgi:hypothetical protein